MTQHVHNGQTTTFVWDNFNRMVQSNSQDVRTTYVYDALGRRIMKHSEPIFSATSDAGSGYEAIQKSKIRREKNLGLIIYGWDGDTLAWESNFGSHTDINHQTGQIEAAFDNSRTTHYIYEPNSFVPMIQASRPGRIQLLPTPDYGRFRRGEAQYDIDQDPVWLYQAKAQPFDAVAFYQCDHLGTPQELTDMNGEIAWAAEYKAWGYAYDALSKAGRQAGLKQPLRFQGQYYDHETGLHYNRHRYYDPHSGRFVSKDPIGLRGGMNNHAYAINPVHWVDPSGLDVEGNADPLTWGPLMAVKGLGPLNSYEYTESVFLTMRSDPNIRKDQSRPRTDGGKWEDGCGDKKTDQFVPDVIGLVYKPLLRKKREHIFSLMEACSAHDRCYANAAAPGASKNSCDWRLRKGVKKACVDSGAPSRDCDVLANAYYAGVSLGGGDAWKNAGGK